jgi:hypothetical protein
MYRASFTMRLHDRSRRSHPNFAQRVLIARFRFEADATVYPAFVDRLGAENC